MSADDPQRALEARLVTLRTAGAAVFDGPAFRFVEALLERASDLDGTAATRIHGRAESRLDGLEAAFERAREEAEAALDGLGPSHPLRGAFEDGDFKTVLLHAPAARRAAGAGRFEVARQRLERVVEQARAAGVSVPERTWSSVEDYVADGGIDDATKEAEARRLSDRLAQAVFRQAAEGARASIAVARANDELPPQVGHYNPQALAAAALTLAESVDAGYLRAYVASLEDLAALRALPPTAIEKRRRRRR